MSVISTIPERCRRCYTCVRECPVKAIKVEGGQAAVIAERCIACGNCVKVCAQKAKQVEDAIAPVRELLAGDKPVFACLAPSFPAAFDQVPPGRLIAAVRALGFKEVWDVSFGAELVAKEYQKLFKKAKRTGKPVIATCCPAVVTLVEKYLPELHGYLAPIVAPKLALARAIRRKYEGGVRVVFIGPCTAKKLNLNHPSVGGAIDAVLTFDELQTLFDDAGIAPAKLRDSGFDGPRACFGRSLPLSGGLLRAAGLGTDILENDIITTEGKDRVMTALKDLADGRSRAVFYDLLFCRGCIDGPKMLNDLSMLARREILVGWVNEQALQTTQRELVEGMSAFPKLDLSRTFTPDDRRPPLPSDEDIEWALAAMRKARKEDRLDCGACGYDTCRDKAVAVCQGLAEPEMCLPYLVDELQETVLNLKETNVQLESAQKQLVKSERLASMGQLSAGIAHELNNPLGTVLLYSHMLMRDLKEDPRKADVQMIVSEAVRCKDIVRGLLDFARQSRVSKAPCDVAEMLGEVVSIAELKAQGAGVTVTADVRGEMPVMMIDRVQIRQALVNLVNNGIDSIEGGGEIRIAAWQHPSGSDLFLEVRDTGCGIPPENLARLFTPFFTTKAGTKGGTGLGLAITYGVIKMHSGDITVDSEVGKGTVFTIRLPVRTADGKPVGTDPVGTDFKVEEQFFR